MQRLHLALPELMGGPRSTCASSGDRPPAITQVGSWELEKQKLVKAYAQVVPVAGMQVSGEGFLPQLRFSCRGIAATLCLLYRTQKSARILKYLRCASHSLFLPAYRICGSSTFRFTLGIMSPRHLCSHISD